MTTDKDKFLDLWQRIDAKGDGLLVFNKLKELYSEPKRKYHNANHIHYCLEQFEYVRHLPNDPEAVEMAIWLHDAIYDPEFRENELQSAVLASSILKIACLPFHWRDLVFNLILWTRHISQPKEIDAQVLVDIDLSSLGKPWEGFIFDSKRIREEYWRISDKYFQIGRCVFFKKLLKRPTIYLTQFFNDKYEAQAQENLKRWIKEFGSP